MDGQGSSGYFAQKGDGPTAFINQVNFEMEDEIAINIIPDPTIAPSAKYGNDELFDSFYVFQDGSSMTYDKKELFLKLEEGNTQFLKENFDIEVFEVTETQTLDGKFEYLNKLSFVKEMKL